MRKISTQQDGITLLITLLVMGVLLAISASILSITLKQYQLAGIANASEIAFQAAGAGMECILYHDLPTVGESPFAILGDGSTVPEESSISCMNVASGDIESSNNGTVVSGEEQKFLFSWGSPEVCSEVSVYKFFNESAVVPVVINGKNMRPIDGPCPAGSVCTVVQARGYNVACSSINTSARVVEREYTQVY